MSPISMSPFLSIVIFVKNLCWSLYNSESFEMMVSESDVGGLGHRKSGQLCIVLVRPDRQTTDNVFFLEIRTESGQLTESRQTESGQTDTGQKIRTESGQQTDTGHDFPENQDKNETRTGHGQYCPPTSGLNHYVNHFCSLCWSIFQSEKWASNILSLTSKS